MNKIVILTMKWGEAYSAEYVNRIYSMLERNLTRPFDFVCFTDNATGITPEVKVLPLPEIEVPRQYDYSPWRKLSMFQKNLLNLGSGEQAIGLFLDLDLIIVDNIDCFLEIGQDSDFYIIENWTQLRQGIGNSSIYRFPLGEFSFIYEEYIKDPLKVCSKHDNEQIFLSKAIAQQGIQLNFWPASWCRSFKRHSLSRNFICNWFREPPIPENTKVMVFHGHPKPDEASKGIWPTKPFWKKFKPATWVDKYWR